MTTTHTPITEPTEFDALTSFLSTEIPADKLQEGMLVVDDLGCVLYTIDRRLRRKQGDVRFMVWNHQGRDVAGNNYHQVSYRPGVMLPVATEEDKFAWPA